LKIYIYIYIYKTLIYIYILEDIHGAAEEALGNQREEEQIGKRTREE